GWRRAGAAGARQTARHVADLDSEQFDVREEATRELEKYAEQARPALQKALEGQPSVEVRQRAMRLLERLMGPVKDAERLRVLRAVEVLEQADTADSRRLLEELAKGAPGVRETEEASAALRRLSRR